jgi:hypothetical protein
VEAEGGEEGVRHLFSGLVEEGVALGIIAAVGGVDCVLAVLLHVSAAFDDFLAVLIE